MFSGKVVLKGWGYTLLVFKVRVHGTIKSWNHGPIQFCFLLSYASILYHHSLFYVHFYNNFMFIFLCIISLCIWKTKEM